MSQQTLAERLIKRFMPVAHYSIEHQGFEKGVKLLGRSLESGKPVFVKMGDRWFQIKRHRTNRATMHKQLRSWANRIPGRSIGHVRFAYNNPKSSKK